MKFLLIHNKLILSLLVYDITKQEAIDMLMLVNELNLRVG